MQKSRIKVPYIYYYQYLLLLSIDWAHSIWGWKLRPGFRGTCSDLWTWPNFVMTVSGWGEMLPAGRCRDESTHICSLKRGLGGRANWWEGDRHWRWQEIKGRIVGDMGDGGLHDIWAGLGIWKKNFRMRAWFLIEDSRKSWCYPISLLPFISLCLLVSLSLLFLWLFLL